MTSTVQAPPDTRTTKRADELERGDVIAERFLGERVTVASVHPYSIWQQTDRTSVMVVHVAADGYPAVTYCVAAKPIPVEAAADPTGLGFSREPDAADAGTVPDGVDGGPVLGRAAKNGGPR